MKPTEAQLDAGLRAYFAAKEAPPRTSTARDPARFVLAIAAAVLKDIPEPTKPKSQRPRRAP